MTTRSTTHTRRRWSKHVTENSHAMDLENGVFAQSDPKKIAQSLKNSADHSKTRKADPFRSAMSMLTFYTNRAGKNLKRRDTIKLEKTKAELRRIFGRDDGQHQNQRPS
jgi:hypothetical protein